MKYVVVGGDAAGMSAAMQLLKHDREAEITILEKGAYYSYAQCGMPYAISGVVASTDDLVVRSVDTFRGKYGMDARVYHHVEKLDTKAKVVSGRNTETGEEFHIAYDKLLIATGASPFVPEWEGRELAGVHTVKTIPDTEAIIANIEEGIEDVTVVGGGYIGLEMAENFRLLKKRVRLLVRSRQVAKMFDQEMADLIVEEAERHGIDILFETEIEAIFGDKSVSSIQTNKGSYNTDLVVVATGVQPNTAFLQETGVKLAKNGAVHVNEFLETNVPNVYAAGDCALQYHRVKKAFDYIPLGTHANKQGRLAGMNMAGKHRAFKGVTGTSVLQFMDVTLAKTGLSDRDAEKLEVPHASVTVTSRHHAAYYPGAKKIWVKLTFRSYNGVLLGGQIIGEAGVDKRVDVLATALFNEMTMEQLEDLDLSYAPPYNSTWDPIQQAARKAVGKLEELAESE